MAEKEQPIRAVESQLDSLVGSAGEYERKGIHIVNQVSAPPDELPPSAAIAAPAPQAPANSAPEPPATADD